MTTKAFAIPTLSADIAEAFELFESNRVETYKRAMENHLIRQRSLTRELTRLEKKYGSGDSRVVAIKGRLKGEAAIAKAYKEQLDLLEKLKPKPATVSPIKPFIPTTWSLQGVVVQNGKPLANALVYLFYEDPRKMGRDLRAVTDAEGNFTIALTASRIKDLKHPPTYVAVETENMKGAYKSKVALAFEVGKIDVHNISIER